MVSLVTRGFPGFRILKKCGKFILDINLNDREVSSPLWRWPLKDRTWAFAIAQTDRSIWVLTLAFFLKFSAVFAARAPGRTPEPSSNPPLLTNQASQVAQYQIFLGDASYPR